MRYLENLEFYPDEIVLGSSIAKWRWIWTLASYVLLSLGLFSRQLIAWPKVELGSIPQWGTLAASFIVGLAVFPPAMRWLNRKRRRPSVEHILGSFTFGFFLDSLFKQALAFWVGS